MSIYIYEQFVKTMLLWIFMFASTVFSVDGNVTYDGRSLIVNGERKLLFSGSIHYPRSTPEMWPSLISKAKEGELDVIQTYVFWNLHEPKSGQYDFEGGRDLIGFIKLIQAQGLYACIRIGPFIESEWTYGGLPFWLHDIPGIVYRSNNKPFKFYMQRFTKKIVNMLKSAGLYASQGGPIILSQIENEYERIENAYNENGPAYVRWAASMAVGLDTGVPWLMCRQNDAPNPVISTCNGLRCEEALENSNNTNTKPAIWTELWTSWFQTYGEEATIRSPQDIAFRVAHFIALNGSYVNYYMYHGGTNFGRTASAYVTTSYYDHAPLDEYGLIRQPLWGHLKELHAAIKLSLQPLLSGRPTVLSFAKEKHGFVFKGQSEKCVAFLLNNNRVNGSTVLFRNSSYHLPPKSISILPDCKTEVFNTAKIGTQNVTRSWRSSLKLDSAANWQEYKEIVPSFDETLLKENRLLEQTNTTKDISDYLWYTFKYPYNAASDGESILSVYSLAHVVYAFVNGEFIGYAYGSLKNSTTGIHLRNVINLKDGTNDVSFLSVMVGLPDFGVFLERRYHGLRMVRIQDSHKILNLKEYPWGYQVGMAGEKLKIYEGSYSNLVQWQSYGTSAGKPLVWYKTTFDAPAGNTDDPVTLNFGSMGKGEAWVNGQSLGRYWISHLTSQGNPSQKRYHIPRSFLKTTANLLVILEEQIGNPLGISIDIVATTKICGLVISNLYLPPVSSRKAILSKKPKAKLRLQCPPLKSISKILFASYGTPSGNCGSYKIGNCGSYKIGNCHSPNSLATVEKACLGKGSCVVPYANHIFGVDPCRGIRKTLLVDAQCI